MADQSASASQLAGDFRLTPLPVELVQPSGKCQRVHLSGQILRREQQTDHPTQQLPCLTGQILALLLADRQTPLTGDTDHLLHDEPIHLSL